MGKKKRIIVRKENPSLSSQTVMDMSNYKMKKNNSYGKNKSMPLVNNQVPSVTDTLVEYKIIFLKKIHNKPVYYSSMPLLQKLIQLGYGVISNM